MLIYWYIMDIAQYLFKNYDVIYKNNSEKIILTIDDVPYQTNQFDKILETLDKYNCKATFFVISSLVNESNKSLLIKAIKNGHHLANHGVNNTMHAMCYYDSLHDEIETCQKLINQLYNEANVEEPQIKYFRPGVGIVTHTINEYCKNNNYKIVLGTNYCNDPKISSVTINEYYIKQHLKSNDIIILHDRKWTPELLERLFSSGIRTHSLNELN